jgi:hypothetical protein
MNRDDDGYNASIVPIQEGNFWMRSLRSLDGVAVIFDDEHAVADAGLVLPATLVQQLALQALIGDSVDLGVAAGRAHVGARGNDVDPLGVGGR